MSDEVPEIQIEHECRRVAAAFDLKEWHKQPTANTVLLFFEGTLEELWVRWDIERVTARLTSLSVGRWRDNDDGTSVDGIYSFFHPDYNEAMARGLYCLGFEDESILSQLPQLSANEKMELRLSMPREFWPKK